MSLIGASQVASVGHLRDLGLISGSGRSSGGGHGNPLQYSCMENPMDREVWHTTVHGVAKESDKTEVTEYTDIRLY